MGSIQEKQRRHLQRAAAAENEGLLGEKPSQEMAPPVLKLSTAPNWTEAIARMGVPTVDQLQTENPPFLFAYNLEQTLISTNHAVVQRTHPETQKKTTYHCLKCGSNVLPSSGEIKKGLQT